MLIVLLTVLTISLTATANEELEGLQKVPAGFFLSESVAQEVIENYPELEKVFENAMKVEAGSYMENSVTIDLANKIEEVNAGKAKYKEKYEVTHEALKEERSLVEEKEEANKRVTNIQDAQIEDLNTRYEKAQFRNTAEKIGLAVIVLFLATNGAGN